MQKVVKKEIMRGVNLTCVTEYKFKTGSMSLTLMAPMDKRTAALNAVLPSVLRRGTARYPNMEAISAVLDDLYGARIEPVVRKRGETQCVGFYASFPDDAFIPDSCGILSETARLMGEMLLSPATSGGRLRSEYVDSERENLIDDIRAEINDKRRYASQKLIELMCKGERYGVSRLGTLAEAGKISVFTLTRHYRELIATAPVEVFYCGAADPDKVEIAVREALASLPRTEVRELVPTEVRLYPAYDKPRYHTERLDVTQGKLCLGYRLGDTMNNPNYAAMMVFNAVFGGSVTSKLFMNVREKLSLCYYASSSLDRQKGVMLVSSGIEFSRYDEAFSEITAQLDAIRDGDIEDWELTGARRAVSTAILSSLDSLGGIEAQYLDRAVFDTGLSAEELAALVEDVTKEDITAIARNIRLDTVYFLTGEEDGDE